MYFLDGNFDSNTLVVSGLNKVYGIGGSSALKLCALVGISSKSGFKDIDSQIVGLLLKEIMKSFDIDLTLKRRILKSIGQKVTLKVYQGVGHLQGLPVGGQGTKTNSGTAKRLLGKFNV